MKRAVKETSRSPFFLTRQTHNDYTKGNTEIK